ncbi:MAG: AbgT family transporter [Defluviitaleaceae bacterium]|nr:AbgT family transporter [Defluviitaleaceae bacterium]
MKSAEKVGIFVKILDRIEIIGNKLPNPATIFVIFSLAIIIASHIAARAGISVSFTSFNADLGTTEEHWFEAVSLMTAEGFRFMVTSFVSNFVNFLPVGTVFTVMLGIGVADRSGLLKSLLRKITKATPAALLSPVVVLLGILSNVASVFGFVVLMPLSALLFISCKRHPLAGLAASFAGVSGGWAANIFIAPNDIIFADISTQAAHIIDTSYVVLPVSNWYFMAASTVLITALGAWVTDAIVEPRLGKYNGAEDVNTTESVEVEDISAYEKRGLKWAGIALAAYAAIILALLLPANAVLRNPDTGDILVSPFMSSILFFVTAMFLVPGIAYGTGAGTIRSDNDIINMMVESVKGIVDFLVLIFFAAQFVAHFNYSNLGIIMSISGAGFLSDIGFQGLPLLVSFILLTSSINLFFALDIAKWAMMAPVFVPMFMLLGISPEVTQLAYRIGDSTTNMISPLMPFFPMMIAYVQKYNKHAGIGTTISLMLPYNIFFLSAWIILFAVWYILGLPPGPGSFLAY